MQELGTDLMLICSNVSPLALGGIDRAAAISANSASARPSAACASATRRWPGAATSTTIATPGRSCAAPIIPISGSSSTASTRWRARSTSNSIRSIPKDKIFIVQLADAPLIEMDLLYWSRHFRNMPGQGDLPVVDFMRAVAATGYDGAALARDLQRPVPRRLAEVDRGRWPSLAGLPDGRRWRGASRRLAIQVPAIPDRVQVEGVEFVEFAADETEAENAGRHLPHAWASPRPAGIAARMSRCFRQGEINIVINTEKEGFAHCVLCRRTAPRPTRSG